MTISDETLMKYVDHELDAEACAAVEAAMAADPALTRRVARQQALVARLRASADTVLAEPLPERLLRAVAQEAPARVVDLEPALAARREDVSRRTGGWSWREWGGIAASLIIGVIAGHSLVGESNLELLAAPGGGLVAAGPLARALSEQLANAQPPQAPIRLGPSFVAKSGEYCRSFVRAGAPGAARAAGLACRSAGEWRVPLLTQSVPDGTSGGYRMAGSDLPQALLQAIDERIAGSALDAAGEQAAMQRGWQR